MSVAGYWCLGLVIFTIIYEVVKVALRPILHYEGTNPHMEVLCEWAEDTLQTTSVALFLSLPLAAVYGCYLIGQHVWGLLP